MMIALTLLMLTALPAKSPMDETRRVLEAARAIVDDPTSHDEKLVSLDKLLETFLDTDVMGRSALADHWKEFNSSQQQEFLKLFRELFQRTYVQKLLLFEKPDFGYDGEKV